MYTCYCMCTNILKNCPWIPGEENVNEDLVAESIGIQKKTKN